MQTQINDFFPAIKVGAADLRLAKILKDLRISKPLRVQTVSFEDLPAEIRNVIYLLAFERDHPLMLMRRSSGDGIYGLIVTNPYEAALRVDLPVDLLRTSRAIHNEATPVLYGANTFIVPDVDCLEHIKPNLIFVRKLMLKYSDPVYLREAVASLEVALRMLDTIVLEDLELQYHVPKRRKSQYRFSRRFVSYETLPLVNRIRALRPTWTIERIVGIFRFTSSDLKQKIT